MSFLYLYFNLENTYLHSSIVKFNVTTNCSSKSRWQTPRTLTKRTVALEDCTHMYMGISFLLLHVHEYRKYIDKSIIPLIKFRIL